MNKLAAYEMLLGDHPLWTKLASKGKLQKLLGDVKRGFTQEGGFPTGELVHQLKTKGGSTTLRDVLNSTTSDSFRRRVNKARSILRG